jgi:DNA-binding NarL/FixJ family response regulator
MSKIRIFLVDDHDMFRDGVKLLLSSDNLAEVVAEARNGKEFLEKISQVNPDVVLMDISMPEMDGIEASRLAHEQYPNLKILALTMFGDEKYYYQMIQTGIKGFVLKSAGISELTKAITEVSHGENFFSSELLYKLIQNINAGKTANGEAEKLSAREIEVLKLISSGFSNEDIGKQLNISLATVKTHRSNLLSKTASNNTASLIMYALKHKLIELN